MAQFKPYLRNGGIFLIDILAVATGILIAAPFTLVLLLPFIAEY